MGKSTVDWWAYGVLCALALVLSLTFVFVKLSLDGFSLIQIASGRTIIAAGILVPLAFVFGPGFPQDRRFWVWSAVLALTNFVLPFYLLAWGQAYLPTNLSGAIFGTMPLAILALSGLILGVKITRRKTIGLVLGTLGLIVLTEPTKWLAEAGTANLFAIMSVLAALLLFALSAILMRLMPKAHPFSALGAASLIAAGIAFIPLMLNPSKPDPSILAWVGLLGSGVFSTAIAYTLRFYLIRRKGPVFLAPNAYIGVLLVNTFGITLMDEVITQSMWLAFPLIIIGLIIAQDGSGKMEQV